MIFTFVICCYVAADGVDAATLVVVLFCAYTATLLQRAQRIITKANISATFPFPNTSGIYIDILKGWLNMVI